MAQATSIQGTQIIFRCRDGQFPGIVIDGGDGGRAMIVVFGAPHQDAKKRKLDDTMNPPVPTQLVDSVPYGSRVTDDERKGLFPYWDYN